MTGMKIALEHITDSAAKVSLDYQGQTCEFYLVRVYENVCTVHYEGDTYHVPSVAVTNSIDDARNLYKKMLCNFCTAPGCAEAYIGRDHSKDSKAASRYSILDAIDKFYHEYILRDFEECKPDYYLQRIDKELKHMGSKIPAITVIELLPDTELPDGSIFKSAIKEAVRSFEKTIVGTMCEWCSGSQPGRWDTDCGHTYFPYVSSFPQPEIEDDKCPWCGRDIDYRDEMEEEEE